MKKRKKIWASDAERIAWDAKIDADIAHARDLARRGWAELGIPEPEDKVAHIQELMRRHQAGLDAPGATS